MSNFTQHTQTLRDKVFSALVVMRLLCAGFDTPKPAPVTGDEGVLIGPANSAGQGVAWARALECARPESHTTAMQFVHEEDPFAYPVDQPVLNGFGVHSHSWQRAQQRSLRKYRAVLVESAMPILGGLYNSDPVRQIESLQEKGVRIALLFHGSDLRDPDRHLSIEPLSYFAVDAEFTDAMRQRTERSRQVIRDTGLPIFVSTPDLLQEVEGATWLPVVVDVEIWQGGKVPLSGEHLPRVLHIPSSSRIKGTALIEPVLRQLHSKGVIEYQTVRGVPHSQMPELVRSADIVVDQVRGGPYGVAACEAMAAGRIVVSHVRDEVRQRTSQSSGCELPVVEAVPDTLEEVIRNIIASPEETQMIAAEGSAFVRHWHDGRESGRVLANWLELSDSVQSGRLNGEC